MKKEEHDVIEKVLDLILQRATDVNDLALKKLAKIGLLALNSLLEEE